MSVMLNAMTGMAIGSSSIGSILQDWADMGIFAYALPFLLLFAIVFGILQYSGIIGDNKGVHTVIALAVGLLALQFNYVTDFFSVIFPYAGVGIAVLLVAIILMGLFIPDDKRSGFMVAFFVIGGLIALIIVLSALSSYEWWGGWWWQQYWPAIIAALVIGGLVVLVIFSTKGSGSKKKIKIPIEH